VLGLLGLEVGMSVQRGEHELECLRYDQNKRLVLACLDMTKGPNPESKPA